MVEYLLTSDGQKVYAEDVESFFAMKRQVLSKIKSSSRFTIDAQNQDFTKYKEVLEILKLSKPDGTKLDDIEVQTLQENNMIGSKKKLENSSLYTKNKVMGSIFGFVIGDALGVPVEFSSREKLEKNPVQDYSGFGTYNVPAATWSDDTSMTLATMDSINKNNTINYDDIMNNFCEWYKNAKYTATGVFFDIGNTTRNALSNFLQGEKSLNCGGKDGRSNGNGSLMRILPVSLFLYSKNVEESKSIEIINNVSSLTHAHEISRLGCTIYNDYISLLLKGKDKKEALLELQKTNYGKYYSEKSINSYHRILKDNILNEKKENIQSSGYVVSTLEASIYCFLTTNNYREAVLKAVNLGDDTDTVAAVTGSIAGIYYGFDHIPKKWIDELNNKELLGNIVSNFIKKNFDNNYYKLKEKLKFK